MGSSDLSSGDDGYESSDGSGIGVRISSEVMVASVIFLFLVVIFVFFLYLYAKYYWGQNIPGRRRAHFIFAAGGDAPIPSRGLDPSVLRSLPVSLYNRKEFKDGIECSVCLCELSDGEEVRLLPKCNHGFHLRCIDMWLHSHSTCPLCRCSLGQEPAEAPPASGGGGGADAAVQPESPVFPTNVLFWGNQERVNARGSFPQQATSSRRTLVISLPNRMVEGFPSPMSPLPSSRFPSENVKSPAEDGRSPGTSKFRSLRRLWSRGKRTGGSPSDSSPMGGDIEQGFGGYGHPPNGEGSSNVPKTPTAAGS